MSYFPFRIVSISSLFGHLNELETASGLGSEIFLYIIFQHFKCNCFFTGFVNAIIFSSNQRHFIDDAFQMLPTEMCTVVIAWDLIPYLF